ncbi:GNAT family N-acetyltransferase [Bauldia sp.]|uniref:GNAT family N-acetyltransferase n=1 Tax=Bauldia sp. TaxID=2575872 RepID=UPI003BA8AE3C
MPPADLAIRPLRQEDRPAWAMLWHGYLGFYDAAQSPDDTDIAWARLNDPHEPMFALGATVDGDLKGIAHCLFHRSFWTRSDYCYLQDLFVAEDARGGGLGRALIEAVYARALEAGAGRVYWLTQEDNHAARALYDRIASRTGFIQYRKML